MKKPGRSIGVSLLLVLCALYFVLAMGLTALSGSVYRRVAAETDGTYTQRTALAYLVNQTRRSDGEGGVSVGTFSGRDALFLRSDGFVTVLYAEGGSLRELYMEEGLDLPAESGLEILPLSELKVSLSEGLLTFTVTDDGGESWSASLRPLSGVEREGGV